MTEDQMRQQKAELLLSYQEAQDNLADLRRKAYKMAEPFATVATWLKHMGSIDKKPIYGQGEPGRTLVNVESLGERLSLDDVVAVTQEINKTEDLLAELGGLKSLLGLR
jgi:hypothetical protein